MTSINLPSKIGRKNTVLLGIAGLVIGFLGILIYLFANGVFSDGYHEKIAANHNQLFFSVIPIYLLIVVCGAGWALINANSYPMMVEISTSKTIGKFTGYYYTVSMVAQTITPILIGLIMYNSQASLKLLYIYSAILMVLAFVIMFFYQEKKTPKNKAKKKAIGFDALDVD